MRYPTKDFVVAACCTALIACSEGPSAPAAAPVASLTLSVAPTTLIVGATITITAETYNANGQIMRGRSIDFASSNVGIASVTPLINSARLTAIAPGTSIISASSEGKTATIALTISAPPLCAPNEVLPMTVGQVVMLSAAQKVLLCLGASADAAEYKLVIANTSVASNVTLNADNTAAVVPTAQDLIPTPTRLAQSTHDISWPKRSSIVSDVDFLKAPMSVKKRRASTSLTVRRLAESELPSVGSVVTLNGIAENSCDALPRSARVVTVGKHVIMYVDAQIGSNGFSDAQYASLAATFDTLVYPLDTLNFGSPRDLDGNGRIGVYFLPGAASAEIDGLVNYRDFDPTCAGSNGGEYMYLTPPDQAVTGAVSINETFKIAPAVMAHELQHIINGSLHFPTYENASLNEGLSHVAEELYFFKVSGSQSRSNYSSPLSSPAAKDALFYMTRNFSFYWTYLARSDSESPLDANGSAASRGSMWNFLRYAADRRGGDERDTWRALAGTTRTGVTNLTNVFGTFQSQLRDWAVANVADDVVVGIATTYTLPSWNIRSFLRGTYPLHERDLVGNPFTVGLVPYGTSYHQFRVTAGAVASVRTSNAGAATTADVMVLRAK